MYRSQETISNRFNNGKPGLISLQPKHLRFQHGLRFVEWAKVQKSPNLVGIITLVLVHRTPAGNSPQFPRMTFRQWFQPASPSDDGIRMILKYFFEFLIRVVRCSRHELVHARVTPSVFHGGAIAASCESAGVGFEAVVWSASQDWSSWFVLTPTVRIFITLLIPLRHIPLLRCHHHQHFRQRRKLSTLDRLLPLRIIVLQHPFPPLQ
mmetsp:Transcript_34754/g.73276  ORF Transcript_34754/g.73276 Transcript_34754/m.73276 type:complete len:208 (+) Transcript_34754:869-1492(+)